MGSSNSKKDQSDDLYFAETAVSRISTQYQTERKKVETEDVFVHNMSQESMSKKPENFSTFIPSTQDSNKKEDEHAEETGHEKRQRLQQLIQTMKENNKINSDGMDSDDSSDWGSETDYSDSECSDFDGFESDVPEQSNKIDSFQQQDQLPLPSGILSNIRSYGYSLKKSRRKVISRTKGLHPGGSNPTLGVQNFERASELTEINYEVTTVNTSAIRS